MKTMPIIWFRYSEDVREEYEALTGLGNWTRTRHLLEIPPRSVVVGRYSVLPFYKDIEEELALIGSRLINSYEQHLYLADVEQWYQDLFLYTPQTWFSWEHYLPPGSYVLKGRTNSRKHQWNRQMFCPTREDIPKVAASLMDDTFIREQGLCLREYVPLKKLGEGINGLPISNEWRVFFLGTQLIAGGFYWSNFSELQPYKWHELPAEAYTLLDIVREKVSKRTNFYVVDIAEKADGDWIVIELNDGQMSGLSCIDPAVFYHHLLFEYRELP